MLEADDRFSEGQGGWNARMNRPAGHMGCISFDDYPKGVGIMINRASLACLKYWDLCSSISLDAAVALWCVG